MHDLLVIQLLLPLLPRPQPISLGPSPPGIDVKECFYMAKSENILP